LSLQYIQTLFLVVAWGKVVAYIVDMEWIVLKECEEYLQGTNFERM
jgi:hypothetical protein